MLLVPTEFSALMFSAPGQAWRVPCPLGAFPKCGCSGWDLEPPELILFEQTHYFGLLFL